MKRHILFAFTIVLFSLKPAFNQQVYKFLINIPSPLPDKISETMHAFIKA